MLKGKGATIPIISVDIFIERGFTRHYTRESVVERISKTA